MTQLDVRHIVTNPLPERKWILPRLVPEGSIIVLAGDAGIGKSCLCYAACLALACGEPFLECENKPLKVLYFDEENSEQDVMAYLWRLWRGMRSNALDLLAANLRVEHFSLSYQNETPVLYMREVARVYQPQLIVIDTLTICCRIEDENSNAEMGRAIRELRAIKSVTPPASGMLLLHHTRMDPATGSRDIRGAKGLKGWTDGTIIFKPAPGGRRRADGLRRTVLSFNKMRIFGSHEDISIDPQWDNQGGLIIKLAKVEMVKTEANQSSSSPPSI